MPFNRIFKYLFMFVSVLQICFSSDLTYTAEEGKSPGTFIGDISADSQIAKDHKDMSLIRFSQLKQGVSGNSQLFKVSKKTGKLYTLETLDAEVLCKRNEECFQMMDVAIQKASSTIEILEVKIFIQDINDHQPEFPHKHINIKFDEAVGIGMKKSIPNAIDNDVGIINSQITYELKKHRNEPFSLSESKGVDGISKLSINLDQPLDREEKDSYMIRVIAKDGGSPPKQSTLDVHISVTDVNDNIPTFSEKIYNVSINNKPSDSIPIIVMAAKDLDIGENGKIAYRFSSQTANNVKEFLKINEETGEVYLYQKLNPDQMLHNLYIEAKDGGIPPLSSVAKLIFNVVDQQNNDPIIKVNFASTSKENTVDIPEDIKVGNFIAYVKVIDNDSGQNGEVKCHLHHDKFQLQNLGTKKYEVTLKTALDREKEEHHDVVISCQDKGSPPLHSNSKFSIQVMDINDVRPQFTKDTFKFYIDENENARITLGYINATDPDLGEGGKLTYSILSNNKKDFLHFKISPHGLVSAIMSLDHEFQDTYSFDVFVKDNGTPSLNNTVNVIVEVIDKNDNAPYFTFPSVKPYNLDVIYYPHQRTKNITRIKAADSDSQENAFLKYQIIRGNDKQMFTMNQYTGLLGFNRQLSQNNAGSYQLDIVVKDSGSPVLSATTTLFLTLTISNKTQSEMLLNDVLGDGQLDTEEKVHLNLVIIITGIAVTIAVFITASLSICIIRCNAQSNVATAALYAQALDPNNRYQSEQQRHLIAPPHYQPNSWPRPNHPSQINQTPSTNTQLTPSRGQLEYVNGFPQKSQLSNEVPSQAYTQNISIPPDYFTWRSAVPSQSETDLNWREQSNENDQQRADLHSRKSSAHSSQLSKSDISGPYPQSRNLVEMNNQQTSNTRPLPPVPHTKP